MTRYLSLSAAFFLLSCTLQGVALGQFELPPSVEVPLYYDPNTGNLTMDATGLPSGFLFGYSVGFNAGNFDPVEAGLPQLHPDAFTPFMGTVWGGASEWSVGETNFAGVPAGVYSLGNVLPAGLSRETGEIIDRRLKGLLPSTSPNDVLDAISNGITHTVAHTFDFIYGESPYPPINGDGAWVPAHQRWAESASLLYDPTDGGIAIDSTGENGGAIALFGLQFSTDALVNVDQWQPTGDPAAGDGGIFEDGLLTEFFTSGLAEGYYELGKLLPAGLSSDEVAARFESAAFVGLPGHSGGAFDLAQNGIPMSISVIPEPSGIGTVTLAFSTLLLVRRRRRSFGRRPSSRCVFVPG